MTSPNADTGVVRVGTVCVVTEKRQGFPDYLFGVYTSREEAIRAYGEDTPGTEVVFDLVPLWSSPNGRSGAS